MAAAGVLVIFEIGGLVIASYGVNLTVQHINYSFGTDIETFSAPGRPMWPQVYPHNQD
jgi:hypothetical protein